MWRTSHWLAIGLGLWLTSQQSPSTLLVVPQHDPWRRASNVAGAGVSGDGRWIAFESYDRLVPADDNTHCDIYVLERATGRVTLESVAMNGDVLPGDSTVPRLNGNGRYLVFETASASTSSSPIGSEIVLRDRLQHTSTRVTRRGNSALSEGRSRNPAISDDGRFVSFASTASDLVAGPDENGHLEDVYVFEASSGRIDRVSLTSDGRQPAAGASHSPSISGDGQYVAFTSTAPLTGERSGLVNGRPIASVYVRDTVLRRTVRVSTSATGAVLDAHSSDPAISRDGRYVVFTSEATNLIPGDRNGLADIFAADLRTRVITLISRAATGGPANGASRQPAVSADGRYVAFQSDAPDLICAGKCLEEDEDINLVSDVFLAERGSGIVIRISRESAGGWPEESSAPQLDGEGGIVTFLSRHPIDADDIDNDFDLFVRIGISPIAVTRRLAGLRRGPADRASAAPRTTAGRVPQSAGPSAPND
jgi:Tol biopolymer transport system component